MSHEIDYVSQFQSYLLTEKRVSQNTFMAYKSDIDQLVDFLNENKVCLGACKKKHLKEYLKKMRDDGLKAKTVSRKISSIKFFFDFLSQRFSFQQIARSLVFPKLEKKLPSYLSEQELKRVLSAANKDNTDKGIRNKVMLSLLYATGMRVSELVSLTIDQIQFDQGYVKLSGKGNKERIVPLPRNILNLLRYYLDIVYYKLIPEALLDVARRKNFLFVALYNNDVKHISRQSFWIILKKILSKASIFKNISPHSLRHSLATHLLKNGADIRSLQLLLGHENLSTVQIYTHLENSELREIYDKKHPRSKG